jgi:hypothetical protein
MVYFSTGRVQRNETQLHLALKDGNYLRKKRENFWEVVTVSKSMDRK